MAKITDLGEGRFGRYERNDGSWAIITATGTTIHTGYATGTEQAETAMRAFLGGGDAAAEPSVASAAVEPTDDTSDTTDDETDEPADTSGKKLKGKLPDGFPGKAALEEAGYGTYAKVRKLHDHSKLTDVPGIGEATAGHIGEALSEG